jgi:hypothetical protein
VNTLFVIGLIAGSAVAGPFKCGGVANTFAGYDSDAPLIVVDDRVLPASESIASIRADMGYVEVTCWNPETGEFGVAPGIPLLRIISKSEYRDVAAPALTALQTQVRVHRETGEYISILEGLELGADSDLNLQLDSGGPSWRLILLSRFQRCEVSNDLSPDITRQSLEHEACALRPEEQSAALRRAYTNSESGSRE